MSIFLNFISQYPHLYISNQYILHTYLLHKLRDREREADRQTDRQTDRVVLYNNFHYSLLCIYLTISFVWVTILAWCKSTPVFANFVIAKLLELELVHIYDWRNCGFHHCIYDISPR